ncbi:MAG: hypothetical protein ONB48_18890 [candidate division KSB1 bacterium]|nr:hypothetical protein [candidate division KSB1 bacterium]MDZ7276333.1 hypothetical protein [candidate division KSB1 bacterium]MDZ7287714.1 hypothetical protein [candidate division KSB1 bacterium]MDZ7299946.1 hypothetical protein [candidate division KSB1 bacterium]MDZ7305725.1 hypothetical protein [candidate division KSB1 bacterium]
MKHACCIALLAGLPLFPGSGLAQHSQRLFAAVAKNINSAENGAAAATGLLATPLQGPQWQPLTWPDMPLRCLSQSPAGGSPKLLVAGSDGILRPFTNPTGWRLLTDWQLTEVLDVAVDPLAPRTIYAATANGIFVSTDEGRGWQARNRGLASTFVSCLLADPQQPGRWFAGTEAGLYESLNGGQDWRLLALEGIAVRALLREKQSWPGIFWVGTENHGLYESFDGAKTFAKVDMDDDSSSVYALAGGGANEPIYAGLFAQGLYRASSPGELWEPLAGSQRLGTVFCILPLPEQQLLFVGTHDQGVFRSTDGGQTWQSFGLEGATVRDLMLGEAGWARP